MGISLLMMRGGLGFPDTGRPAGGWRAAVVGVVQETTIRGLMVAPVSSKVLLLWVRVTSGSVAFSAENPIALATNSHDTVFRGRWPYQEMMANKGLGEVAFPLNKLVALPLDYHAPVAASSPEASPVTPSQGR
jgi:hypothetical protein